MAHNVVYFSECSISPANGWWCDGSLSGNQSVYRGIQITCRVIDFFLLSLFCALNSDCCCHKLPQTGVLKPHKFIALELCRSEIQCRSHWAKIKGLAGLYSFWRLEGRESLSLFFPPSGSHFPHLQTQQRYISQTILLQSVLL